MENRNLERVERKANNEQGKPHARRLTSVNLIVRTCLLKRKEGDIYEMRQGRRAFPSSERFRVGSNRPELRGWPSQRPPLSIRASICRDFLRKTERECESASQLSARFILRGSERLAIIERWPLNERSLLGIACSEYSLVTREGN